MFISKREDREKGGKILFKEIMGSHLPNLVGDMDFPLTEVERSLVIQVKEVFTMIYYNRTFQSQREF